MAVYGGWQKAVLKGLGAPVTKANLAWLNGWQAREGGSAAFNPMNTTLWLPGATSYNSVGVRNFPDAASGTKATILTLSNYPAIVNALRSGTPQNHAGDPAVQQEFLKWSGGGYSSITPGTASVTSPYQSSTPAGDFQNAAQTLAFLDQLPPVPKGSTANPLIHFESKPLQAPTDALAMAKAYLASTGGAFSNPGFARYAHGLAGTSLPASTLAQSVAGSHTSSPKEGDLAFFGSPATHQGIHVSATHVLHGTDGGTVLRVSSVKAQPYRGGLVTTRSLIG